MAKRNLHSYNLLRLTAVSQAIWWSRVKVMHLLLVLDQVRKRKWNLSEDHPIIKNLLMVTNVSLILSNKKHGRRWWRKKKKEETRRESRTCWWSTSLSYFLFLSSCFFFRVLLLLLFFRLLLQEVLEFFICQLINRVYKLLQTSVFKKEQEDNYKERKDALFSNFLVKSISFDLPSKWGRDMQRF